MILKTNTLWSAGLNLDGQLGLGNLVNRTNFNYHSSFTASTLPGVATQGGTAPVITSYDGNVTANVAGNES